MDRENPPPRKPSAHQETYHKAKRNGVSNADTPVDKNETDPAITGAYQNQTQTKAGTNRSGVQVARAIVQISSMYTPTRKLGALAAPNRAFLGSP